MTPTGTENRRTALPEARRFAVPKQAAFLSQAMLLEEAGPPRAQTLACVLGFVFVCVAIIAGMFIEIDVITTSKGRITAASGSYMLQSFEGGIVDQVAVEEGQVVEDGELLLTLRDPEGQAQFERLLVREAGLTAQVRRARELAKLSAMRSDRPSSAEEIVVEQMSILPLQRDAMRTKQSLIEAEVDRRADAISNLRALAKDASVRLSLVEEKLEAQRRLFEKGYLPRSQLLETEQEASNAAFSVTEVRGQIREAESMLVEARQRLDDVKAEQRQEQGDRLSSLLTELNETRQQMEAARQRLDRTQIRATTRGVVLELKVRHRGETVAPGDPIIEIVPIDDVLIADTRLPPAEVAHVMKEQSARIAIDGLEPHRHGYVQGRISKISPSTLVDEEGIPYYRASISLASNHLDGISLTPGMTVQAQIKTGERTIVEYLLKPIYRAWDTAFRER